MEEEEGQSQSRPSPEEIECAKCCPAEFALPGWAQAEGRRAAEQRARFAQRAEQARAYSGEGRHSEEWGWPSRRPAH